MESESKNPYEKWKILEKYITILLEVYPTPLNQTEIAIKAQVSKAAVSKNKDNIKFYCDITTLAWSKKYVLKNDPTTFSQMAVYSLLSNSDEYLATFLNSVYFDVSIEKLHVYENLSKNFNKYNFNQYYNEEDCKWTIKLIKNIILNSKINSNDNYEFFSSYLNLLSKGDVDSNAINIIVKIMQLTSTLFYTNYSFLKEDDYINALLMRDKSYYFICDNLDVVIVFLNEGLKKLELKEKDSKILNYISKVLIKALIKNFFEAFTNDIYESAKNKKYILPEKYKKINKKSSIMKKINHIPAPG